MPGGKVVSLAISQEKKVNPEVAAPGLTVKDNFNYRIVFEEVFEVKINLDYSGWLERWALKNFQGLGATEFGTKLYFDFRGRVAGTPVHAVHRRVGKGPSPYPCLTTVKLLPTHWRFMRSDTAWKRIKEGSRVRVWLRDGSRLVPSDEPIELELCKVDKKCDPEHLDNWDRVEFSARLTVEKVGVRVQLAQDSSIKRLGKEYARQVTAAEGSGQWK
jgi:hypothetical protein